MVRTAAVLRTKQLDKLIRLQTTNIIYIELFTMEAHQSVNKSFKANNYIIIFTHVYFNQYKSSRAFRLYTRHYR